MLENLKLKTYKNVIFKVRSFAVPAKKPRMLKHTIYAARNTGFTARQGSLKSGYSTSRLAMTVQAGLDDFATRVMPQIDTSEVKQIFCFSTHQGGRVVNCMIAVTAGGMFYTPLFGGLTPIPIPSSEITNFDCFAYSYARDRDYIFAANADGIFVADYSLVFAKISDIRVKQMTVLDKRLFVLDKDGETIHFSRALDLLELEGSICVDGSLGKVMSLENYEGKLLLVCENGFKTLETAFDAAKFRIAELCRSYETVIDGTAKALGGAVFFLTAGGMCKFERGKIELLDIELAYCGHACSTVYDNKYFISNGENMLVLEKFTDSVTEYACFNVRAFERVFNEFSDHLAVLTNEDGFVFQVENGAGPQLRVWESEDFALTYASGNQYIRQVLIKTAADIDLCLTSNRGQQKVRVHGSPDTQKINLNFKGETFRVKLVSNTPDAEISSLGVVVGF